LTHFVGGLKGATAADANNTGIEEVDRSQTLLEVDIDTGRFVQKVVLSL
jgi:hypothetical protein